MKKEVIWGIALAVGVSAIVTGLFLLPSDQDDKVTESPGEIVTEEPLTFPEPVGIEPEYPEHYDANTDENMGDVTRIIIEDGAEGAEEISGILSEKVIIHDEVVDKSGTPK